MKIDIYPHIMPVKYRERLFKKARKKFYLRDVTDATPTLWDLEERFRIMDRYEGLTQVLTIASPGVEDVVGPKEAVTLAKVANDSMAELVAKYPDRFVAAAAMRSCLSLRCGISANNRSLNPSVSATY